MINAPLPQNNEAERSVLGCFLLEEQYQFMPRLKPDLFFNRGHRVLAKAIISLAEEGKPCDLVSVRNKLEDNGDIEKAGGSLYINDILDSLVTTSSLEYWLDILEDKFLRRSMIEMAGRLHQQATQTEIPTSELQETIETMAEQMVSQNAGQQKTMPEIVRDHLPHIISELDGKIGLSTGLPVLDKRIKGLSVGSYIIAGRPGSGKTTFVLDMIMRQAQAGHKVGFISLEMTLEKLLAWMIDFELKRDHSYIPIGGTKEMWVASITEMADAMKALPIIIDDKSYTDVSEVVSSAYRMRYAFGVEVLYIDYMQLLEAKHSRDGSREQEVAKISRSILSLKKKLGIPIVTVCQINRESTKGDNHRPRLEYLRESGSIEQDADVVMMLFDPTHHGEKGLHELSIPKNRSGAVTAQDKPIKLHFNKPAKRFEEGFNEEH